MSLPFDVKLLSALYWEGTYCAVLYYHSQVVHNVASTRDRSTAWTLSMWRSAGRLRLLAFIQQSGAVKKQSVLTSRTCTV